MLYCTGECPDAGSPGFNSNHFGSLFWFSCHCAHVVEAGVCLESSLTVVYLENIVINSGIWDIWETFQEEKQLKPSSSPQKNSKDLLPQTRVKNKRHHELERANSPSSRTGSKSERRMDWKKVKRVCTWALLVSTRPQGYEPSCRGS